LWNGGYCDRCWKIREGRYGGCGRSGKCGEVWEKRREEIWNVGGANRGDVNPRREEEEGCWWGWIVMVMIWKGEVAGGEFDFLFSLASDNVFPSRMATGH
jgi:hypothetical protein